MAKPIEKCCKTCKFLQVTPNKAGVRVVRKEDTFVCTYRVVLPPMPSSTAVYDYVEGYRPFASRDVRRTYMAGDMGTKCPVWEEYAKPPNKPAS